MAGCEKAVSCGAAGVLVLSACAALAISSGQAWSQVTKAEPVTPAGVMPGVQPAGVQPGEQPAPDGGPLGAAMAGAPPEVLPAAPGGDEFVELSAFAEPVELSTFVELVAATLNINISNMGVVEGQVIFNAPVPVKKADLIHLLDSLLEQQGFTIVQDRFGLYSIRPANAVVVNLKGEMPTTRVFSTPNLRPSALKAAIEGQLGIAPQAQGGGGGGGATVPRQIAYIDEMGVIVATDTPRRLAAIESLVAALLEEYGRAKFIRLELKHISAPVARGRALELVGQAVQSRGLGLPGQPDFNAGQQGGVPGRQATGQLDNMGDRMTVDSQGNALIFRGLQIEIDLVKEVLAVIDVPNTLLPRKFEGGAAAMQIADIARQRGLGEVTTIADRSQVDPNMGFDFNAFQLQQQRAGGAGAGGPVMVVDERRGSIVYYGTEAQQVQLETLIKELDIQAERVVTRVYRLRHSDAESVAEIINGLISSTTPAGTSEFLPESGGFSNFRSGRSRTTTRPVQQPDQPSAMPVPAGQDGLSLDAENAFVIADPKNNQILIKAPAVQQPEFSKLIERLDLRRPQVYVEAQIIAVSADDRLRLSIETQLINANGSGGVLNTNWGLGGFGDNPITSPKDVNNSLAGLTAAIIRSDQVPILIRAIANETDSRIVSSPQLLVDDNEEAEVVSLDQQPTSSINRGSSGSSGDIVTAGDYAEAGTTLRVTPRISEGGYLRLKYEVELSSFTGEGQTVGETTLPPPRQQNTIKSESVTVPSDSTVVIGGLVVDSKTKTIAKVPLLGDIPLVGLLFQDRATGDRSTTLYIFLTPKILREPTFADLKLLTRGPRMASRLGEEMPEMKPSIIGIVERTTPAGPTEEPVAPTREDALPANTSTPGVGGVGGVGGTRRPE